MNTAKVKSGKVPPVCLALMLLFIWLIPCAVQGYAREYAVQIAAVRSQQCADEMRTGLLVQGLEAYWVRGVLPEHGLFYRVRLGKFPSIESAYTYAEVLLNSGLLESYAITAYEAPMSGPLRDMTQASIEVQEYVQQGPTSRETNELFVAIGARQWLLPSSRNLFVTTPQFKSQAIGMNGREMLVFALRSHEWRMTPDPSVFFVRAPVVASSTDLAVNPVSPKFEAAPVIQPVASSVISAPVSASPGSTLNPNLAAPTAPRNEQTFASGISMAPLTPPPVASAASSSLPPNPRPPANNAAFGAERNIVAEIGRGNRPTASRGIGYGGRNLGQARLQATAEVRNGQLIMKLRNTDLERSFTGTARVTLSDDRNSNEVSPIQFNLPPDAEVVLPINDPVAMGSNWMLMVFDDNNALRLVRGASVGTKPAPPAQAQNSAPSLPDQSTLNPPQYVTGVYDATVPQASTPPVAMGAQGTAPASETPNPPAIPDTNAIGGSPNAQTPGGDVPAQLTVTPRQIAATSENVTLEFEIASPQPLNYISLTLAAGDYRDMRQVLMSTTRGRVPFLIPAAQAQGAFLYEIKDEAGRVLAGGAGDFRQLASGR